jgi:hypothetical protein
MKQLSHLQCSIKAVHFFESAVTAFGCIKTDKKGCVTLASNCYKVFLSEFNR